MIDIDFINNILADMWNFHMVLSGIMLSVCTLLYSFVLNKRDVLLMLTHEIKSEKQNPIIRQKEKRALNYIRKMRKLNIKCFCVFVANCLIEIVSWVTLRLISDENLLLKQWIMFSLAVLTMCVCVYAIILLIQICVNYRHEVQVE